MCTYMFFHYNFLKTAHRENTFGWSESEKRERRKEGETTGASITLFIYLFDFLSIHPGQMAG